MGDPPSGAVTFLFTDIEGSTRRWEADADVMRAALLAHNEVLRDAIESHGGFLFSHTGDGVVAAFASPMSAVKAAVAARWGWQDAPGRCRSLRVSGSGCPRSTHRRAARRRAAGSWRPWGR
jgi:class 3 adenylate cyclase